MKNVERVSRLPAKSGNLSHGGGILLYESRQQRQEFVPYYITRSNGSELAGKLVTYKKLKGLLGFHPVEDKTLNLNAEALLNLRKTLNKCLAVASEDDGQYLLVRVDDGVADASDLDPALVAQAILSLLEQEDILEHVADKDLGPELISALRGKMRLQELQSALSHLRQMLENGITKEQEYQRWCEAHDWCFGNSYVVRDEVRDLTPGDKVDFLMSSIIAGHRDLIELKRPDMPVLIKDNSHNNYYFSAEVSRAIGQCHRYLDVLQDKARKGLQDHPQVVAYHPKARVIIGRSNDWPDEQLEALQGLNSRLSTISIMTYDHLLAMGERLLQVLTADIVEDEEEDEDFPF